MNYARALARPKIEIVGKPLLHLYSDKLELVLGEIRNTGPSSCSECRATVPFLVKDNVVGLVNCGIGLQVEVGHIRPGDSTRDTTITIPVCLILNGNSVVPKDVFNSGGIRVNMAYKDSYTGESFEEAWTFHEWVEQKH